MADKVYSAKSASINSFVSSVGQQGTQTVLGG
jgi:hypothetical protein